MLLQHVQPVRPLSRPLAMIAPVDIAFWTLFAAAAIVFVLDATMTIHVTALRPAVVEQNPIARWTLEAHPVAPYLLKAAIIAECAIIAAAMRAMHERWAACAVAVMMATIGILGIATAVHSLTA